MAWPAYWVSRSFTRQPVASSAAMKSAKRCRFRHPAVGLKTTRTVRGEAMAAVIKPSRRIHQSISDAAPWSAAMNANSPTVRTFRSIWISDVHLGTRGAQADALLDFLKYTESKYLYL